jgi:hypothetical protein
MVLSNYFIICSCTTLLMIVVFTFAHKISGKYETVFKKTYSQEFPCIIKSREGATYIFCNVYRCYFSVSYFTTCDIAKHMQTQNHKENIGCIEVKRTGFFQL